jgi:nucleotide-binding universal stress UspA family protein
MLRIRTILYPTDFSSYSNQAYLHAVALAEAYRAALTVLYVGSPGPDAERDHWRSLLEQIRPANPEIPVSHVFLEGDAAVEIVDYARDAHFDMIVMGTHGRTGVDRLLMGSVAEKVLRDAPCSVLVIKLPRAVPRANHPDVAMAAAK